MVKVNRQGSQKTDSTATPSAKSQESALATQAASTETELKKGKQSGKGRRSSVGGTAVQGAKSTIPKDLSAGAPSNQQPEYYNREMRRRMQQMGTGPYNDRQNVDPGSRRKKKLERLKKRQEEIRHTVNVKGPSRDIKLGRRNAYFLIGIVVLLVILIGVFLIIRHPF